MTQIIIGFTLVFALMSAIVSFLGPVQTGTGESSNAGSPQIEVSDDFSEPANMGIDVNETVNTGF